MENLFKGLKQKTPDEMEKTIRLKSIEWSWLFGTMALVVWTFYESYLARQTNSRVNLLPCFILTAQVMIYNFASFYHRAKLLKGGEDENASSKGRKLIIIVLSAVAMIAALSAMTYSIMGVRLP